jgi:sugar lactone lactonase YvrE
MSITTTFVRLSRTALSSCSVKARARCESIKPMIGISSIASRNGRSAHHLRAHYAIGSPPIDREGRIYVTSVVGIQVFDSAGKYLGRLRGARNLALGGPDKRTLYLTAADGFFRVKMLSQGPERLGK